MTKKQSLLLHRILDFLLRYEGLVLLLCFQILLRVPNLFEPYWYGDEGIYLTIGTGLRQGLHLYRDIVDHKTPLIYFFAMTPSQFWFRCLTIFWSVLSTTTFFLLLRRMKLKNWQIYLSTLVMVILTTVPWLEGNIPNGELFVMGFILTGAWIFSHTTLFQIFLNKNESNHILPQEKTSLLFISGVLFGLGILTKVPALFDIMPFFFVCFYLLVISYFSKQLQHTSQYFKRLLILGIGVLTPIILSVLYFYVRGSLKEYIDFGLLYNFRYAGVWLPPIVSPFILFALSLKGKILLLSISTLLVFAFRRSLRPMVSLTFVWCMSALVGATLSSRPYPHYLIQVVPPFAIMLSFLIQGLSKAVRSKVQIAIATISISVLAWFVLIINFSFYPTTKYYSTFLQFITRNITKEQYIQSFNHLMADNYQIAKTITASDEKLMYIWGNNPMLYALTRTTPPGQFTVNFHIRDFPGAFEQTMGQLELKKPKYIVVMHDEAKDFQPFFSFLNLFYVPVITTDTSILYQKVDFLPLTEVE